MSLAICYFTWSGATRKPIAAIYNKINQEGRWPVSWETEHLTAIPKNPNLSDLSEGRNNSCTSIISKIFDGEVLLKLRAELKPNPLVRAFLEERHLRISINGQMPSPVPIQRGSPQGSVLGCLLYCVTTQRLTANLRRAHEERLQFFPGSHSEEDGTHFWEANARHNADLPVPFLYVNVTTIFDKVAMSDTTWHVTTSLTAKMFS